MLKRCLFLFCPARPTPRDVAVAALTDDVFSRGNTHLKNVETLSSLPEGLFSFPEVCVIGRPNVGKSTLLSCLLHNPRLGKHGRTPGTTRLLQFFNVGDALLLVDTPGYGGWKGRHGLKLSRAAESANAFSILFRYLALRKRANLRRVYWLLEASAPASRFTFTARDEEILSFLTREEIPFTVVLTKLDRVTMAVARRRDSTQLYRITRDGIPVELSSGEDDCESSGDGSGALRRLPTADEMIGENIRALYECLGTDRVPVIGVSCDRWNPLHCYNIEALRRDMISYCFPADADPAQITYEELHSVSYAPPLAEDITAVQVRYPIESFVIPSDNHLSLHDFVRRHEQHKARLVSSRWGTLTARDTEELHLVDTRALARTHRAEERQRALAASVPPRMEIAGVVAPARSLAAVSGAPPTQHHQCQTAKFTSRPKRLPLSSPAEEFHFDMDDDDDANTVEEKAVPNGAVDAQATVRSSSDSGKVVQGHSGQESTGESTSVTVALKPTVPLLPATILPDVHGVMAINGVVIPRSLVPPSVVALAEGKEDEMAAFALRSGAGAYEELLLLDAAGKQAPFIQHDQYAPLSEQELEALQRTNSVTTKSAAQRRREKMLAKYIVKKRKERSLYMHAEGYMCPWLTSAGRTTVMGTGEKVGTLGKGGAIMRNLKSHGFGGKSYSARTLRGKGRATRKTGSWSA